MLLGKADIRLVLRLITTVCNQILVQAATPCPPEKKNPPGVFSKNTNQRFFKHRERQRKYVRSIPNPKKIIDTDTLEFQVRT